MASLYFPLVYLRLYIYISIAVAENFQRLALRDITLYNGQSIPRGSSIITPAYAINLDPSIYPEPDLFDGLRFKKLREENQGTQKISVHIGHIDSRELRLQGKWMPRKIFCR